MAALIVTSRITPVMVEMYAVPYVAACIVHDFKPDRLIRRLA